MNQVHGIVFNGAQQAVVDVAGDGSSDIDCAVYDAAGTIVAADSRARDVCRLVWTPSRTTTYRVVVRNIGEDPNEYLIQTN